MMEESILDHGKTMTCTELEYINMRTESFTRVNMKTTKKLAMVYINGLTAECTRDIGTRENSTVLGFSRTQIRKR